MIEASTYVIFSFLLKVLIFALLLFAVDLEI